MIEKLILEEYRNVIAKTLLTRADQIQMHAQNERKLGYAPYCVMRKKHNVTGLMLSAFAPDRFEHANIIVIDIYYGLNNKMSQPELKVDDSIIQIYSDGYDRKNKVVIDRCQRYNYSDESRPLFLIMVVTINSEGIISKIMLQRPNKSTKLSKTCLCIRELSKLPVLSV